MDSTTGEVEFSRTIEGKAGGMGLSLGLSKGGFSGALGGKEKTPAGKAIRAAIVDGEDKQRVAAFVADIVRRGLTVDRMACADVRAAAWSVCSRHKRRDASLAAARREPS